MIHRPTFQRAVLLASLVLLTSSVSSRATAAEPPAPRAEVPLDAWLVLGPVEVPLPAFHADEAKEVGAADLLKRTTLDREELRPARGGRVAWPGREQPLAWEERRPEGGRLALAPGAAGGAPRVAYFAAWIEADRFVEGKLAIATPHLVRVFLDGEQVAEKTEAAGGAGEKAEPGPVDEAADAEREEGREGQGTEREDSEDEAVAPRPAATGEASEDEVTADLALTTGTHLLLFEAVHDPTGPAAWTLAPRLTVEERFGGTVAVGTSPRHHLTMSDLLDVESIGGLEMSADGELVALQLRQPELPVEHREEWVEIRRATDGATVRSLRAGEAVSDFRWGPRGTTYSYVTRDDDAATLWVGDLAGGRLEAVLERVEHLRGHAWVPDGKSIVYTVAEKAKPDERGVKRLQGLQDRWDDWRDKTYLYQVSLADGTRRRLTAGAISTDLHDIAPDGSRLLFSRSDFVPERPFTASELYELDLGSLAPRLVARVPWFGTALYAPDGERLLVLASPTSFAEQGPELPAGLVPNLYDQQAYLVDRRTGKAEAISREFTPTIQEAFWSRADGNVYLRAESGDRVGIFRWDPRAKRFSEVPTGVEVVDGLSLARDARRLAYFGSGATTPPRAFTQSLVGRVAPREIARPGAAVHELVDFGRVEDWDFTSAAGVKVPGRVYYPPGFDPAERYPLLVFYYGGTSPTDRSFGGRYPKSLWAAQGYVVYVLQPSGATGFGREFAARHVNDWGKVVAGEIVAGTRAFLAAHPFVDPGRVGCFGGSYGGFMTMLVITETDLFRAAISHAGISSISSYWGEGWWGYLYSAGATADSYPWNRPDIYVEQSPLFRADRITTPLLLVHGTADPNVPPGESEQMYTALTLLGKEVEYVRFEGEAHWIMRYPLRKLWWSTILAWFDRELKGEPEWWEHLYGKDANRSGGIQSSM